MSSRSGTSIIASNRPWTRGMAQRLSARLSRAFVEVGSAADLENELARIEDLECIYCPFWSTIIPPSIHERYPCIIFHMTDVPFGRGGSPLQNLIVRGIKETKICAIRAIRDVDAGDVYLRKPLALYGSAEEIFLRAAGIVEEMIAELVLTNPVPEPQDGNVVAFRRRGRSDGNIDQADSLDSCYDFIRMLDAEGYPRAFLETERFLFEFSNASRRTDWIEAQVRIIVRSDET